MPVLVKSTVFSAALLIGVAASAWSQSASIAALPPGDQGMASVAAAPIGPTISDDEAFPNGPRDVWNMPERQANAPSPFIGPAPRSDTSTVSDE